MSWLKSRRLHYLAGLTALLFVLFAALRMLFLLGFSAVDSISDPDVLPTLGIGLRFDLRLALLAMFLLLAAPLFSQAVAASAVLTPVSQIRAALIRKQSGRSMPCPSIVISPACIRWRPPVRAKRHR